jgi:hypothetical protein
VAATRVLCPSRATANRGAAGRRSIVGVTSSSLRSVTNDVGGMAMTASPAPGAVAARDDGELHRIGHVKLEWTLPRRGDRRSVGRRGGSTGHAPGRRKRVNRYMMLRMGAEKPGSLGAPHGRQPP